MTAALVIRGTAGRAGAAAMRGTTVSDEFTQCWYAPNPTCKEVEWSREWCRFCLLTDRDEKLVEVAHWSGRAHRAEARIRELEGERLALRAIVFDLQAWMNDLESDEHSEWMNARIAKVLGTEEDDRE